MIKYRHRNCDRQFTPATFAYELPEAHTFLDLILESVSDIAFPFGMTLLHPRDQYCKATGREKSFNDLNFPEFKITGISIRNNRTIFDLRTEIRDKVVTLDVSVDFQTMKTRLEDVHIY